MNQGEFSKKNLIVNYLPQMMNDREFRALFMDIGPVKNAQIIRDKATGYSFGFGFVEYKNDADAERAIALLHGYQLQNKRIRVAYSRKGQDVKGANLFVRKLPVFWGDNELYAYFQPYGKIINCRVLIDMQTHISKRIGFVLFDKKSDAENARNCLGGKCPPDSPDGLVIKFADDNAKKVQAPMGAPTPPAYPGHGYGPRYPPAPPAYAEDVMHPYMDDVGAGYGEHPGALYRGDVGPRYREAMHPRYREPVHPRYRQPMYPRYPGAAVSHYDDYLEEEYEDPGHGYMEDVETPYPPPAPGPMRNSRSRVQYNPMGGAQAEYGAGAYSAGAYGGQPEESEEEEGYKLFVYNIGIDGEAKTLWELFGPCGTVSKVDIIMDKEKGTCKGYGFVTMPNYEEAEYAISIRDGSWYNGKQLQVSFKNSKAKKSKDKKKK